MSWWLGPGDAVSCYILVAGSRSSSVAVSC